MRRFGTVLALIGIGLMFVFFGFLSAAFFTELLDGRLSLDRAAVAIITLGCTVTTGWIIVAAVVKRSRFAWGIDGFRACIGFAIAGSIGSLVLAISIGIENAGDLGRIVFFDASAKTDAGWYWPAWMSVVAWVVIAALFAGAVPIFSRWVGPNSGARRRVRR